VGEDSLIAFIQHLSSFLRIKGIHDRGRNLILFTEISALRSELFEISARVPYINLQSFMFNSNVTDVTHA